MEITTKIGCRVSCTYCPQKKFIAAYKKRSNIMRMTFETFAGCLEKMPKTEEVRFSGMCEPWLNPECTKMLMYAYKRGFGVTAFSALAGMKPSDIDAITSIPFKFLCVHLPSQEGYEKIKVDNKYLKILNTLLESKIIAELHCHSRNTHPRVKKLVGDKMPIRYFSSYTRGRNVKLKGVPVPARKHGTIWCRLKLAPKRYLTTSNFAVLFPNGEVSFCCQDWGLKHILGNLLLQDYGSLFKGDEFFRIVIGMSDESQDILCRFCEISGVLSSAKTKIKQRDLKITA